MSHPRARPVGKPFFTTGTSVLVAIMGIGYGFGLTRLTSGLESVTNLNNNYPWGIWIAIDVACGVALAAGGFTTAALVHIFGRQRYHALVRPALLTAWLGYLFVGVGLLFDLGRYWNIWRPLIHWQGNSVLFEVGMCVITYLLVLTVELAPSILEGLLERSESGGWGSRLLLRLRTPLETIQRAVRAVLPILIVAGVVLSCMHQSSLGALMMIAPTKLSPWWYTPVLPVLFLMSAIMVGFPVVVIESLIASKSFGRQAEMAQLLTPISRLIPWLIGAYGLVKVADLVVRYQSLSWSIHPGDMVALAVELGVGVVLPLTMLSSSAVRRSAAWLFYACFLVVIGVVLNRINVFIIGFHPPLSQQSYFPAFGEIAFTAGMVASLMLLYRFVANYFPILESSQPKAGIEAETPRRYPGLPTTRQLAARAAGVLFLLGFVMFYTFVHHTSEKGQVYEHLPVVRKAQAWPKLPEVHHIFRPLEYQNVFTIDHPVVNLRSDDYEPVRFSHRSHDGWTHGNCAVCHHRRASEEGDRVGQDIIQLHRENDIPIGGACSGCHQDLNQVKPEGCASCHGQPNQLDRPARPGLKAAYHRQCMGCHEVANSPDAPMECQGCHHPNVPDHSSLVELGPSMTPEAVTARCLTCHRDTGKQVLATNHWRWRGSSSNTRGHQHRIDLGKTSVVNNYLIYAGSSEPVCSGCHIGFGRGERGFNPDRVEAIDCLVCHDTTGSYHKDAVRGGRPGAAVDLTTVAKKVGRPTRATCGRCHFHACGGPNEKHGDLGPELSEATPELDVHMGRYNLRCQDCHKTLRHRIAGQGLTTPASEGRRVKCEKCHGPVPHEIAGKDSFHLNDHLEHITCQTCHIPYFAKTSPTVIFWDWSTAAARTSSARLTLEGSQTFDRNRGTLTWGRRLVPSYAWYNGTHDRHLLGDRVDPQAELILNQPGGNLHDTESRIAPFKIHRALQPIDAQRNILAVPGWVPGFESGAGWEEVLERGMTIAGIPFSKDLGFTRTKMFGGIHHEVEAGERALRCADCHQEPNVRCGRCHNNGDSPDTAPLVRAAYPQDGKRLDFKALGYEGDPAITGGRLRKFPIPGSR